ncbi:MAG: DegV family protein [Oscillospiraceae bacterium]
MNTKILVDSGSDISAEDKEKYNIDVVPLTLVIDGKAKDDFYNFDIKEYCNILRTNETAPTTSQPSPDVFISYFKKYENEYENIIVVTMSHNGSGTYNSAVLSTQLYKDDGGKANIFIVDSLATSYVITELAIKAAVLLEKGENIDKIVSQLEEDRKNYRIYYLVDDINFLIKGGRVSAVKGAVISRFQIKPIISITSDGSGCIPAKSIGYKNGMSKLVSLFEKEKSKNSKLHILHADCLENAQNLLSLIKKTFQNVEYQIHEMKGVMSTHSGPGSLCIVFETEK